MIFRVKKSVMNFEGKKTEFWILKNLIRIRILCKIVWMSNTAWRSPRWRPARTRRGRPGSPTRSTGSRAGRSSSPPQRWTTDPKSHQGCQLKNNTNILHFFTEIYLLFQKILIWSEICCVSHPITGRKVLSCPPPGQKILYLSPRRWLSWHSFRFLSW